MDDAKVERIRDAHPPNNRKELRSFLGLASYYRRFIKGFAKIGHLLTAMTSQSSKFAWTEEMQSAFDSLKKALITAPVLAYLIIANHSW